ncbi:divergent polysaccharide deacetylase family protein [Mangrovicella endophytica]|uniref:divergent polysaccharide deacetylase family protein n=1 Tax=Mangrovicella endophytica TaxID=2066697 RepID=UPI000C9DD659|nr:divergent polysaccharide deacetylase family protein [Mangrovicella endophytica]
MQGDIYRPLGLDIIAKPARRPVLTGSRALALASVAIICGGSLTTALVQPQFRVASVETPAKAPLAVPAQTQLAVQKGPALPTVQRATAPLAAAPQDAFVASGTDLAASYTVADPAAMRQSPSVAHLPEPDLTENSQYGPLPVRAADGRRPLDVYSMPSSGALGTRIAIVVGGLGISQTGTQNAIRSLPDAVTLAFSPTGNSLGRWMQDARRGGHELLLQAPLEPVGYPDVSPSPNTLTAADAAAGHFNDLYASLARMTNYVGVMNYMGAKLTADRAAMNGLLGEIGRRGLLYLDDGSSSRSLAKDSATLDGVPIAVSDILLDGSQEESDIRQQLDTLERVARARGTAIGTASAFDVSVATIAAWINEARGRGIEIVPISALAYDPERQ